MNGIYDNYGTIDIDDDGSGYQFESKFTISL